MKKIIYFTKAAIHKLAYYALLSPIVKRTEWYKKFFIEDIYPGNIWYRKHDERNFDIVTLGSSSAKWAYDFSDSEIKGMNWAQQPQTLVEDYNLLRNFHSILKKGGIVIITIMPFTGLNKKTGIKDAMKYLKVHFHEPIQPYLYAEAKCMANMPMRMGKPAMKATLRYLLGKESKKAVDNGSESDKNPMTADQLDRNALGYVNGWKAQFNISDFEAPLTEENRKGRAYRIELMQTIIDFCIERNYQPVFVIPPVTTHLAKHFTPAFEKRYIYDYLKEVNRDIPLLDYSKDATFLDDNLYFNSFFLNRNGRKLFTGRVISDLKNGNYSRVN